MSQYLTEEEIPKYCTSQAGVELGDILIASQLIDGYIGKSFDVKEVSETVNVNAKHRGKLKFSPVIEVKSVTEIMITPLGVNRQSVDKDKIILDVEQDGYFAYIGSKSPFAFNPYGICEYEPHTQRLEVTYDYGYSEVPEEIKVVCGMLAQNIRQLQSFVSFKRLNTLDYTVEMANPSFFSQDMRMILDKYREFN